VAKEMVMEVIRNRGVSNWSISIPRLCINKGEMLVLSEWVHGNGVVKGECCLHEMRSCLFWKNVV
jgi:hypothetical protein